MENPIKMDDLGVPLFLETPIKVYHPPNWFCPSLLPTCSVQIGRNTEISSVPRMEETGNEMAMFGVSWRWLLEGCQWTEWPTNTWVRAVVQISLRIFAPRRKIQVTLKVWHAISINDWQSRPLVQVVWQIFLQYWPPWAGRLPPWLHLA